MMRDYQTIALIGQVSVCVNTIVQRGFMRLFMHIAILKCNLLTESQICKSLWHHLPIRELTLLDCVF